MARSDPTRVLAASLIGVAAGFAKVKRCTRDEALVEIAECIAESRITRAEKQNALNAALAYHLRPGGAGSEYWYPQAIDLLVAAGADLDAARAIVSQ